MKGCRYSLATVCLLTYLLSGCLEPYLPPSITQPVDLLVIDGYLDIAAGTVVVRVTHALSLSSQEKPEPELHASVSVEQDNGDTFQLIEQDTGTYALSGLTVSANAKYRLHLRTANETEYASDFVSIKETPPIDSVTWRASPDGVQVSVNAHDDTGETRYYRWDFVETWQYHATTISQYKLVDKVPIYRTADEYFYTCWKTIESTKILIGSTERLERDVVNHFPLVFLPKQSSKISIMYSSLVKQRAISKEEFTFLEQLQKTTEGIGGLFDAQPSQVLGNIHNLSNSSQVALGNFSAGHTQQERLFLDYYDLPPDLQKLPRPLGCQQDTVCIIPGVLQCTLLLGDLNPGQIIGIAIYKGMGLAGFTLTNEECADCRKQGGVLKKPDFWP